MPKPLRRGIFTCGGTAGHINPAVALARMFQERQENCQVLFVGAKGGMEERLVPKEGFPLETVTISSFWRSFSPAGLKHNLGTLRNLHLSRREAADILDRFQPELVVGTGGYASYPVVHAAAARGIPTAVHESNAVPGLTTRQLAKVADRIMVGYEESRDNYSAKEQERVVVTGTPVRGEFFTLDRARARLELGLTDSQPLVISFWGSQGAGHMSARTVDFVERWAAEGRRFHYVHAAGRDIDEMPGELKKRGIEVSDQEIRPYIDNMPVVMAAADLVICRAGASTIGELTALGKPAILVPSPFVAANHQYKNAKVLYDRGGVELVEEKGCTGEGLYRKALELLADGSRRAAMGRALKELAAPDAAGKIYENLMELLRK